MAIKYSVEVRNEQLEDFENSMGIGNGLLRILTGSPPANADAAETGTLLVSISLPADPLNAPSGGSVSKNGTWSGVASANGTAGYFRITNSGGSNTIIQGTVGTSGADMIVDNASITSGQTITVTSFTITNGNA